jgi:5-methyltetrahydropteroyltriglutamate--homocysteine methyltransferase
MIKTAAVSSYALPDWLELVSKNFNQIGKVDIEEMVEYAVIAAIHDQMVAGLDVIIDGPRC